MGGPWTIDPITLSIVNPASIGIEFPDDLISEEASSTTLNLLYLNSGISDS